MARKSKLGEPNNFWKYGSKFHDDPWIAAIASADDDSDGDNAPLVEMLLSDAPLDGVNRHHLAHLLRRKKFKHKGGNPATPSYKMTFAEGVLADAVAAVKDLIKRGDDEATAVARRGVPDARRKAVVAKRDVTWAVDKVSKKKRIDDIMLAAAVGGKLGSARRAAKRMRSSKKT